MYINTDVVLKPLLRGLTVDDNDENNARIVRVLQRTLLNEKNIDTLISTPGLGFDVSTPSRRAAAARAIRDGAKVGSEIGSETENLFTLDYSDTDPVRARNVVQGLLTLFIETNLGQSRADLVAASEFLEKQITEYEEKVRELEARIAAFRTENVEVLGEPNYQTRLAAALTVLRNAQMQRKTALEARDRLVAAQSGGAGGSAAVVAADPSFPAALARLQALQTELNTLLLTYTDEHPDVQATRREIAALTQQYGLGESMGAEVARPMTNLPGQVTPQPAAATAVNEATQVAAASNDPVRLASNSSPSTSQMRLLQANFNLLDAERQVAAAEAALRALQQYSGSAPVAETTIEQLNRDYAVVKENYEQLIRRRESARMTQAVGLSSGTDQFRILEAPSVASSPWGPDRRFFMLLGAMLAVTAGAGFAYSIGLLRGTFVSAAEAERALGLPVIAQLTGSKGILSRVSKVADGVVLLGIIGAIFLAALVLSAADGLLVPMRAAIYEFLESGAGQVIGNLF